MEEVVHGSRTQKTWVLVSALCVTKQVTSGKSLLFLHLPAAVPEGLVHGPVASIPSG